MRLDTYLAAQGQAKSRTQAATRIREGYVSVNGKTVTKPSLEVTDTDAITVTEPTMDYVSRGGWKLHGILESLSMTIAGLHCADIGASTGGFTDCLLKHGAAHVVAVDSGSGQLDNSLRQDARVTNIENYNARYIRPEDIGGKKELVVADVSFISQTLLIPAITTILQPGGRYICLVKPQFECGREALNKNGVVRDKHDHLFAMHRVYTALIAAELTPIYAMRSPIQGGDGNTEFLIVSVLAPIEESKTPIDEKVLREVVYGKDA